MLDGISTLMSGFPPDAAGRLQPSPATEPRRNPDRPNLNPSSHCDR